MYRCLICTEVFDKPLRSYDKGEENQMRIVTDADSEFSEKEFKKAAVQVHCCPKCGAEEYEKVKA